MRQHKCKCSTSDMPMCCSHKLSHPDTPMATTPFATTSQKPHISSRPAKTESSEGPVTPSKLPPVTLSSFCSLSFKQSSQTADANELPSFPHLSPSSILPPYTYFSSLNLVQEVDPLPGLIEDIPPPQLRATERATRSILSCLSTSSRIECSAVSSEDSPPSHIVGRRHPPDHDSILFPAIVCPMSERMEDEVGQYFRSIVNA